MKVLLQLQVLMYLTTYNIATTASCANAGTNQVSFPHRLLPDWAQYIDKYHTPT
jgi:hypothetical protein